MSSYDDAPGDTRSRRLILDRQERLERVLDLFSREMGNVELSLQTKREIVATIVDFHRVLSRFEGKTVLSEGDMPDISPIRERLGRTTKVRVNEKEIGGGMAVDEVPAIDELDPWYLEDVANQLEAAAEKLGHYATAKSGKGELYSIKLNPEDYDDPVSDDVQKPE